MDSMEVGNSEEEMEDIDANKENEERPEVVDQTDALNIDGANSPVCFSEHSTAEEVREDMQAKLQIGKQKSQQTFEVEKANSLNRGDGAIDQQPFKSKEAVPSTSKVVVRRKVKPRVRELGLLRPILPRKSKEKARQMLKVIARGILIPRGVVFQQRTRRSRRMCRPNMKTLRLVKKRKVSKSSLHTVWARDRSRRYRSRSADSFQSDYECARCCRCNSQQFS